MPIREWSNWKERVNQMTNKSNSWEINYKKKEEKVMPMKTQLKSLNIWLPKKSRC